MITYKLIPTFYFKSDGSKAKCLTEGGFYRFGRILEASKADELLDVWNNNKPDELLSLKETLQNIEIRQRVEIN